jgi:hypothetical protein
MEEQLRGWKAIAAYLRVGPRTAIRWGNECGLPVHRAALSGRPLVFAWPSELDSWLVSREQPAEHTAGFEPTGAPPVSDPPNTTDDELRPRWLRASRVSPRALCLLVLVVVAVTVVAAVAWRGHSRSADRAQAIRDAEASARVRVPIERPEPATTGGVCLFLRILPSEDYWVRVDTGAVATLKDQSGARLTLRPVVRDTAVEMAVLDPTNIDPSTNSAHELLRFMMPAAGPASLRALGYDLRVTLTDSRAPGSAVEGRRTPELPCCLSCGEVTVCALEVAAACGRCAGERAGQQSAPR